MTSILSVMILAAALPAQDAARATPEKGAKPAYRELQKGESQVEGLLQASSAPAPSRSRSS